MKDKKKYEAELSFANVMCEVAIEHYGKDGADIEITDAIHDIINKYRQISVYYQEKLRK